MYRPLLSPSGVQSIKTRFAFHRRDVRESPDCAIGRTNFSCLSLHSPRTTRYAQIKLNLQVLSFLIQNFPLAKALERNYGRSSWETAGSPWRDSYDMDRKWPGVSPGKEKTDIALCLWNLLELILQKKKKKNRAIPWMQLRLWVQPKGKRFTHTWEKTQRYRCPYTYQCRYTNSQTYMLTHTHTKTNTLIYLGSL